MSAIQTEVREALRKLERWVQEHDWKGYDTFDGLSSPFAPVLTLGNPFLKQVWQQAVRRFPINFRPALLIKPAMSTKAMGFFAQGYLRMYEMYNDPAALEKAKYCLQWLIENPSPGFKGYAWGNHFPYQHRAGSIAKGVPTIVWTGLIGHAFADAYDQLREERYLDVVKGVCEFIKNEIGQTEFGEQVYLHYYPGATHVVHNSNMIGASILARGYHYFANASYLDLSSRAVAYTLGHQLPEGSWTYGVGPRFTWIDSFHTAYVLEALDQFIRFAGIEEYKNHLEKGYQFYTSTFFGEDGTPRYYHNKQAPLDIQCASQGIQTLLALRRLDSKSVPMAEKVARWTIRNMQDPSGYFFYRKYSLITNKTATMHWGQATMFAALALLDQVKQSDHPSEVVSFASQR